MVVRTLFRDGTIELKVETVAHGRTMVVGILTCLDSPDGRCAALHLANVIPVAIHHVFGLQNVEGGEVKRLGVGGDQTAHE